MPDRDIFNLNVPRGWQRASRRCLGFDDDPNGPRLTIRALGQILTSEGCPALSEIVKIAIEASQGPNGRNALAQMSQRLARICCEHASVSTEILAAPAKRGLLEEFGQVPAILKEVRVAIYLLSELADAMICPEPLIVSLAEKAGESFQVIDRRRAATKCALRCSLEVRRIAESLILEPTGTLTKVPRAPIIRMAQAELLNLNLV